MGLFPCPLRFVVSKESQSHSHHDHSNSLHFESSSSSSSLSSQPSLPSVPSLTLPYYTCQLLAQQTTSSAVHHQCLATLKGHSSCVFSLALAGKFLLTGSSNSEVRAWYRQPFLLQTCSLPSSLADHSNVVAISNGAVKALAVLGDKLFSAHQDQKIRVWKIDNNNNINDGDKLEKCNCIATLPTAKDRFLRFFSAKNYVEVRRHKKCTWVHHVDTVSSLTISSDGSLLFSASWDRTFKVWRTSDFRCLESVNAHEDAINAIVLSDAGVVYTGSADKKIKAWKRNPGEKKHSLIASMEGHKTGINALALSHDGSVLYSGTCDRSILVWEKDGGGRGGGKMVVAGALRGHTKAILCLAVVSELVCSGSADKTVRIWRRGLDKSYCCLAVFDGHRQPVKCMTAAVDCSNNDDNNDRGNSYLVYTGSLDCDIRIWHIWVPIL